ncbi:hypothetical protein GN956_G14683 [Arapaima gigas]
MWTCDVGCARPPRLPSGEGRGTPTQQAGILNTESEEKNKVRSFSGPGSRARRGAGPNHPRGPETAQCPLTGEDPSRALRSSLGSRPGSDHARHVLAIDRQSVVARRWTLVGRRGGLAHRLL